jgi:hypothetical protein
MSVLRLPVRVELDGRRIVELDCFGMQTVAAAAASYKTRTVLGASVVAVAEPAIERAIPTVRLLHYAARSCRLGRAVASVRVGIKSRGGAVTRRCFCVVPFGAVARFAPVPAAIKGGIALYWAVRCLVRQRARRNRVGQVAPWVFALPLFAPPLVLLGLQSVPRVKSSWLRRGRACLVFLAAFVRCVAVGGGLVVAPWRVA